MAAPTALRCAICGVTYTKADGVEVYRIDGLLTCELCREEQEEHR